MWVEGSKVRYVGEDDLVPVGSVGTVLADAGSGAHVLWATGASLMSSMDITPAGPPASADGLDDSLDVGIPEVHGVRHIAEQQGPAGVLNVMSEQGHLAGLAAIAEDAWTLVQAKVRQDPALRSVAAQLDEDEAEGLYATAAAVLVRDAFGGADEG